MMDKYWDMQVNFVRRMGIFGLIGPLDEDNIRGFALWNQVLGLGNNRREPHHGSHDLLTMNSSLLTEIPDKKADELLSKIYVMDIWIKEGNPLGFCFGV